ncbi:unnamed protein product, partial [Ectocarpus sp. 8 AP-2014]
LLGESGHIHTGAGDRARAVYNVKDAAAEAEAAAAAAAEQQGSGPVSCRQRRMGRPSIRAWWCGIPSAPRRPPSRSSPGTSISTPAAAFAAPAAAFAAPAAESAAPAAAAASSTETAAPQRAPAAKAFPQQRRSRSGVENVTSGGTSSWAIIIVQSRQQAAVSRSHGPLPRALRSGSSSADTGGQPEQQQQQQQQQKKKEKEPAMCRGFAAGYCSAGVGCFDVHDGRTCEERRTAWLAGGRLPDPQPPRWGLIIEAASRGGGRYGGLPGIAAGVPPVLVIADIANKNKITEFVCLAMETATGRQLGRFARFVRVVPTPKPPAAPVAALPAQVVLASAMPPHQLQLQPQQQQQQLLLQLQPQQLMQQPQQTPLFGDGVPGGIAVGDGVVTEGVSNPLSSALPLPDVLQELQQWMASIGLNPGPRDAAGFSERGNFRWVVTHGSGFHHLPELIGQHKLQLPEHLRSWTDAARMCGWEAERLNVGIAAYNAAATGQEGGGGSGGRYAPRSGSRGAGAAAESAGARSRGRKKPTIKHSLPQSGLPGMLKFLGCPKEPDIAHRTRRGMNVVESLAQCVVCMVRLGISIPVTSRITQEWAGGGGYAGCHHDELSIDQPQVVLKVVRYGPDGLPAEGAVAAAGTGPVVRLGPQRVMGGGPLIMNAPNPTAGINRSASGAPTQQQPQKTKKKKNKQGSAHNGVSANGVYAEGPPFVGGPAQQQHQQQHQLGPGARPGDGLVGGPQWQNGAPGGGWVGGAAGVGGGRGQPIPHWRQNVPINSLAPNYLDYFVRERERQYYKSAGILPYRRDPSSGEVWVLVGSEIRKNKLVVSCLGGKREDSDAGPEHTAWREFWEESGKVTRRNLSWI